MSEEERRAEKKKKKKKHKDSDRSSKKRSTDNEDDDDDKYEAKIRAKQEESSLYAHDDENEENETSKSRSKKEARRRKLEREKSEHLKNNEGDDTLPTDAEVYCPTGEADADIMAEINQDGAVQVDESGGIQAFVAETIEIDGDDVGIIKSDAEVEIEEKRKYSKMFLGAVAAIVVGVIVIAVPLTLKFGKGGRRYQLNIVTQPPTEKPSMMPSESPSGMPSSIRFMEITDKMYFLSGDKLYEAGSPQYLAAMWMADKDPMMLDLDDARFEQRYVMALFYYAMDGPRWVEQNGWLSELSECYWFGIDGTSVSR